MSHSRVRGASSGIKGCRNSRGRASGPCQVPTEGLDRGEVEKHTSGLHQVTQGAFDRFLVKLKYCSLDTEPRLQACSIPGLGEG